MGSVGSSSARNGSLGKTMGDNAGFDIETLSLSVGLKVDEEGNDVLDRFLWPSTIVMIDVLAHGLSSNTTGEFSEWNDLFVLKDVFQISDSFKEVVTLDSHGYGVGVFEVCSQVINSAFGSYIITNNYGQFNISS